MKKSELQDILCKIAALASQASKDQRHNEDDEGAVAAQDPSPACTPKTLPKRLLERAAKIACEINPLNAPQVGPVAALDKPLGLDRARIAVLTSKYWGTAPRRLSVSFMESTSSALRSRIISHLNAWFRTGSIEFVETNTTGVVRISRGDGGYWSYLGTDVSLIPQSRQTMNLQGFTMQTRESEFVRVIRHEAGHTLGFPHEHMRRDLVARIDREKAYRYFLRTQGWDRETVDQQVLTPLDERSLMSTPADQTSIMSYQLPGSITTDGRPIIGGVDINATDFAFVGRIYPKPFSPNDVDRECCTDDNDWDVCWE